MTFLEVLTDSKYKNDNFGLSAIWAELDSKIYQIIDPETGDNPENACIRHLAGCYWLYVDDVDGFAIKHESDLACLDIVAQ